MSEQEIEQIFASIVLMINLNMLQEQVRTFENTHTTGRPKGATVNQTKKILIADDDQGILQVMAQVLRMEGYEVIPTPYGSSVLEMEHEERPDLVLLDLWMAGIDGRDICRRLKSDDEYADIPVVLISAGREIKKAATQCNADDYLAKPFNREDLVGLVRKYFSQHD